MNHCYFYRQHLCYAGQVLCCGVHVLPALEIPNLSQLQVTPKVAVWVGVATNWPKLWLFAASSRPRNWLGTRCCKWSWCRACGWWSRMAPSHLSAVGLGVATSGDELTDFWSYLSTYRQSKTIQNITRFFLFWQFHEFSCKVVPPQWCERWCLNPINYRYNPHKP